MAYGKILTDHGNGFYQVEVQVNRAYITNAMERINAKITHIDAQITTAEAELIDLQYAYSNINDQNSYDISILEAAIQNIQDEQIAYYTSLLTTQNSELAVLKDELRVLQQAIPPNPVLIAEKEAEIAVKESEINSTKETLKGFEDTIKAKQKEIEKEQKEIDDAKTAVDAKEAQIATMESELLSLQKRYALLNRLGSNVINYNTYAWCCDITEGLSGYVPLIEIGTEIKTQQTILNIPPGYKDGAGLPSYTIPNYGEFSPFIALPVADSLRNFIAMPAIQKWAPGYRYGTIAGIDYGANTCSVNLTYVSSSIQGLGINQSNSLTNVPVEYMSCDAGAFEVGDEVVVQFLDHNWSTPKVIGFKENPQPCGWEDPWDGPGMTWKYNWVYRNWFGGGTGTDATIDVVGGELTVSYPATDYGSGSYQQEHNIQYWNPTASQNPVTEDVTLVKFKAYENFECYAYEEGFSDHADDYLVVIGWNETKTVMLNYYLRVCFTGAGYHIGCTDYYYDETDWIYPHSGVGDYWWMPELGAVSWQSWTKNIFYNKDTYVEFYEPMSEVLGLGIELTRIWNGGASYNLPKQISGGSFSCDFVGFA